MSGSSLQGYVKWIKRNECYAAEIRYEQYKKALFKDGKLMTKIKFYLGKRDRFKIEAYNPMLGEECNFNVMGKTKDAVIIKFHRYYTGWVIRKIEQEGKVLYEETTL